jgi:nickel/cobalt transporter (NicO) family protein
MTAVWRTPTITSMSAAKRMRCSNRSWFKRWVVLAGLMSAAALSHADTVASLLGNFTVNQFSGLKVSTSSIALHYVVVYGQLPALAELHKADANGDGVTTQEERDRYIGGIAASLADALQLQVDGVRVPLSPAHWSSSLPTEQGGFSLRVDVDFSAALPGAGAHPRVIQFANQNYPGRIGWHEIAVSAADGSAIFDTDAYSTSATNALTDALQALPESGPLDERSVHFTVAAQRPAQAVAIAPRGAPAATPAQGASLPSLGATENAWIVQKTRHLIEAISAPTLAPGVALWTLLAALALGAVHALSPGHGKTIVGAYLIGSRGTPRHAVFLGFTVTVTHTIGVFVVGFATLYASRFIVPERLFPVLSLISALLVLGMGVVLLVQRARAAQRVLRPRLDAEPRFIALNAPAGVLGSMRSLALAPHYGDHSHLRGDGTMHSHGGGPMHSHLPPGSRGERVTWRNLLALGISGGLVPCPSAMVLLLAAIALNKTAYGMVLVLVFSLGLAITLTVVGLLFLYARSRFRSSNSKARWPQLLPVLSAATITLVGIALCIGALRTFP